MEKAREFQKNLPLFHWLCQRLCVDHNKLWKDLKEVEIPDHLTCLLRNLFAGQEATVRTLYGQGCLLPPCLFNLYTMHIMKNARLDELIQAGIKIAGETSTALDIWMIPLYWQQTMRNWRTSWWGVKEERERAGLKLNIKKTKITASGPITSWQIEGEKVEAVTDFLVLGSEITVDGDCSHEIRRWLLLGRKAMTNLDSVLQSRDITLPTEVRIVKAIVFPVVT